MSDRETLTKIQELSSAAIKLSDELQDAEVRADAAKEKHSAALHQTGIIRSDLSAAKKALADLVTFEAVPVIQE